MNINELIPSEEGNSRLIDDNIKNSLRVSCPGIIQSFDAETQTVTVQLAIRERMKSEDNKTNETNWVQMPPLLDVPIVIPRAGGYSLTLPVKKGDECLVMFSDMCIDAWFSHGGIQNQIEKRRHDLSDAFAILGLWSQPKRIKNYSEESAQLRNESGESYIELKEDTINIVASNINLQSGNINLTASRSCALKGTSVTSNGLNVNTHRHSGAHGETSEPY